MKKIIIILAILIAVGILGIITVASYVGRDISKPDTSDLVVSRPDLPPDENAYTFFISATNTFYWPTNSTIVTNYLEGESVNQQTITELIVKNEDTFNLIKRGIGCQRCITPEVTGFDTPLPYLTPLRNMGKMLAVKTRNDRLAKRFSEATETCISHLKYADLFQKDPEALINYLIGIAILEDGLTQARDLARDPGISSLQLKELSETLANLGPFAPSLIRAIKNEYKVVANTIDEVVKDNFKMDDNISCRTNQLSMPKGKRTQSYFFQPNKTKLAFANLYRDMITNTPLCYIDMNLYEFNAILRHGNNKLTLLFRPNAVGKILYSIMVPAFDCILERKCRIECSVVATHLLTSIHLYNKRNGSLPETLQQLVPTYLKAVPVDPYDCQKFRYVVEDRLLYSVGKDGKDSGGSSVLLSGNECDSVRNKRWNSEDVVYMIENMTEQTEPTIPSKAALSMPSDIR